MSYRLTAAAISADVATAPQKMVLVVLADIADDAGKCWPSLGLIAKRAAMSRKSVIDQIPKLEAAGHLTVRRDGKHNVYRVHPAGSVTHGDQTSHRRLLVTDGDQSPTVTSTVTHSDHHQSLTVTPLVTDGDPNQSLNQSINQSMNQPSTPPAAKEEEEVKPEKEKRAKPGPEPEACTTTLPGNPSTELAEAWQEWQQYRQRRAIAPGRQRVAWTAQAARLSAKQVTQYAASHGSRIVCDRIASAINGEWQGLNLDKLDNVARSGKMSYEEEARIHKPNPNSEYGF